MTNVEIVRTVKNSLKNMALADCERASCGGAKMGAFILLSCLIDALAGFKKGADTCRSDYVAFVNSYLINTSNIPIYDGRDLYKSLRCKLVHSYSEGGKYLFTDNSKCPHLTTRNEKTIINLEDFLQDVSNALEKYFNEVENSDDMKKKLVERYKNNGILTCGN